MTAGQIAATAEVAAGTFYNHFQSVDDLIDALAHDLGRGIEIGRDTLIEIEHDPGQRVAIGVLQLLQMAEDDPVSAAAFVTLAAINTEFRARVRGIVGQAIREGVEAGCFDISAGPAATNAVLGATLQSMRSRLLGESEHADAMEIARLVMRLLGATEIEAIVQQAHAAMQP